MYYKRIRLRSGRQAARGAPHCWSRRAKRSAEENDVQLGAPFGAISDTTVKLLTGEGPSRAALGDTELGFLDQVLGIEYVAARLDPSDDLGEDPFSGEYDVSWPSRVRRASRAVVRWAAANRQPNDGDKADAHPSGEAHPSSGTSQHHTSDVTPPRDSPGFERATFGL